ncbi:MAG: SiaC family regulatory phosphoprotein, partial [Bacteroidales bacterium]|nr:SiaC family regulatory phosphoprotein [Bacteroidales bacterium]
VENYCKSPADSTILDVELEYFNSGSGIFILIILQLLTSQLNNDKSLVINWYYEKGDDDILERGQYYSSLLNKDFVFIRES